MNGNTDTDEVEPEIPITDDWIEEVWIAFKSLKNNKVPVADGIPTELFKTGWMHAKRLESEYSLPNPHKRWT